MTYAINTFGAKNAALAASKLDIPLIHISSDSVFDGETEVPYHEYDKTNPINTYGRSKLMAEQEVRAPTYCMDVAEELLHMADTEFYGTYHIANTGTASRYNFYSACAAGLGYSVNQLVPILQKDRSAKRAKNTMFDSIAYTNTFHRTLRSWQDALEECLEEIKERRK